MTGTELKELLARRTGTCPDDWFLTFRAREALQIAFEEILWLCNEKGYSNHIIINIQRLYGEIETNQIFSSSYIAKTLDIADSNARNLLSKLRDIDVVVPIKGKVKGQYRFKYSDEL